MSRSRPPREGAFKDHFSGHAQLYACHRPVYPAELFSWLAAEAGGLELAWDCATGNGQAARALASHFRRVIATDASEAQIARAKPHPAVDYRVETAERSSLDPASADLVFVSQALHWFDTDRYYREVRRVLRPRGVFAALTYVRVQVSPAVDQVVESVYSGEAGPYWPPERRHVERAYASLPFPFRRIVAPEFLMEHRWTLAGLVGYLRSWSAVQRCIADRGVDPVAEAEDRLRAAWGEPEVPRTVRWPLVVLAGR
jgi:SAM-dependent methyltransferase